MASSDNKLHLGCGNNYFEGFVNLDRGDCRADVYHDLDSIPYPFPDDRFDVIIANHVLEHLSNEKFPEIIAELWRISRPNAVWEFRSPYGLSDNFATDPTHKMSLTGRSFDYYDETKGHLGSLGKIYGFAPTLRVLDGRRVYGDQNGDDVYHRLLVVKGGITPSAPNPLPDYLYAGPEPRVVSLLRKRFAVRAKANPVTAVMWEVGRRGFRSMAKRVVER